MKKDLYEYTVSEHFLGAIINGDNTGLTNEEEYQLETFLAENQEYVNSHFPSVVSTHYDCGQCNNFARCEITGLYSSVIDLRLIVLFK